MELRHALIVKGDFATNKDVQDDAKTPDIDFRTSVLSSLQEFRGSKVQASAEGFEEAPGRKEVAETKVDDFDVTGLADENVFDLQVSMCNTVPVAVVKSAGNLARKLSGLLLFESSVGDDVVKHLAAIYVLEKHVPVVIRPNNVSHSTYVRVVQKRDDGCLSSSPDFF